MTTITPDITKGVHTRTRYNSGTSKIDLAPISDLFTAKLTDWDVTGAPAVFTDDAVIIDNTNSSDRYFSHIHPVSQTIAAPITFRVMIEGIGIEAPVSDGFSIYLQGSYNSAGGTDDIHVRVQLPPGTWNERQFIATISPAQPVKWVYLYVFTRNKKGKVIIRDLELITTPGSAPSYGKWQSDPIDLASIVNSPVVNDIGNLTPRKVGFYYSALNNVDKLNSIPHSIEVLSKFRDIVCDPATMLDTNELKVASALVSAGVHLYGYITLGSPTSHTMSEIQTIVDACAAAGYWGIFWDEAGYGPTLGYSTRTRQTAATKYAVSKGLCCMANSWSPSKEWLTNQYDADFNPTQLPSPFSAAPAPGGKSHSILLESFFSRSDNTYAGSAEGSFQSIWDSYSTTVQDARKIGVQVVALAYQMNSNPISNVSDRDNGYTLAMLLGLDGWSFGNITTDGYVRWADLPDIKVGNFYTSDWQQVGSNRWERDTDLATIWFQTVDSPASRTAGVYAKAIPLNIAQSSLLLADMLPSFTAGRVTLIWETSSDKKIWKPWKSTVQRYVRLTAELRD